MNDAEIEVFKSSPMYVDKLPAPQPA